jgi:hypothetical protein
MDPAFLVPGQLVSAQNATYYPGSPAIQRAAGRTAFGTVSATAVDVVGLRNTLFDNAVHLLIAHASASYLTANVGDTGTFGILSGAGNLGLATSIGVGTQLESAHYRNRFYLFNGTTVATAITGIANSNVVTYLTATSVGTPVFRSHGLLPVPEKPVVSVTATAFSQSVSGYYEYWTTEVALFTQDGTEMRVEGTFAGVDPATILISTTGTQATLIQKPSFVNQATTHWRVYRSPKKDREKDKKFPTGFLISGDINASATSMIDSTNVTDTGFKFPTKFNGVSLDSSPWFNQFTNASAMGETVTTNTTGTISGVLNNTIGQGAYGFNFGGFVGPVQGIEVAVASASVNTGNAEMAVMVVRKRDPVSGGLVPLGLSPFAQQFLGQIAEKANTARKVVTISSTVGNYTLGGPTDRWFATDNPVPLRDTDFDANGFMVVVFVSCNAARTFTMNAVSVKVYYGGSFESTVAFPTVVYTFGDVAAQVGKNGPPPSASTGDVYEDCLVLNDVTQPSNLKWSYPGDPEAFPSTYYLDFETPQNDRITLVKVVNDRLVVGLSTSVFRVNYLPSERDASFDRGKAKQVISSKFGVVNPMCACIFTLGGGAEQLAFISQKGLHTTDAFSFETRTSQLEWRNIQPLSGTVTPIALIDDPENLRLRFICQNSNNANETYLEWHFSYDRGDIDSDNNFKAIGPIHLRNFDVGTSQRADPKSAWSVPRTNGNTSIYYGYGGTGTAAGAGKVYIESGTTIPAEDTSMRWTTRRLYLAGMGQEWKLTEMYGYCGSYSGSPTASYTLTTTKTNDTGPATKGTKTLTLSGSKLHKVVFNQMQEGLTIGAIVTASAYAQERFILDGEEFGDEDSGR